jgi:mycothiol synthase
MRRLATTVRDALGRLQNPRTAAHPEFPDLEPRQLTMAIAGSAARQCQLPQAPFGYCSRHFRPGDEASWLHLIETEFERWDRERFDAFLSEPERRQGSCVIEHKGLIVAATFASRATAHPLTGTVDYVACDPAHRGRKLGLMACGAVVKYLGENGYDSVSLKTDDWRLAAIKVYFDLGFTPVINRIDMSARWEAIRHQLEAYSST